MKNLPSNTSVNKNMKAIILARVSTEEQKEAGNSLPAQIERIKNYCLRKDLDVAETYSFDESAYKDKRDEFDKLLTTVEEIVEKEKIAVCFDKVDRLSRSVFDKRVARLYELAVADKIELHFVSEGQVINSRMSAVEKFQFGMSLGLAKYYSDAISDNTRRAFEQKRRAGEITGAAPVGYKSIPLDVAKRTRSGIVPNPDTAHMIQRLFELYSTGNFSITTLWQEALRLGLKGKNGKPVARSVMEFVLKNTFYYGVAYSAKYKMQYPHGYEPLITKALFDKCQAVRMGRSKRRTKLIATPFVFQGLLQCANCGCAISFERKVKPSGKIYDIGSCTNAKHICKRMYVNEKEFLKPVQRVFSRFEHIPTDVQERLVKELRALNEGEAAFHEREIARIQAEYNRLQKKIDSLTEKFIDESITKDVYDKKLQEYKDEQYRLTIELEEYTKADHQYHIHVSTVLNLSRRMNGIFESSEPEEKRQILNFVLQNPKASGKKLTFTLKKPFDTVLELANCPTGLPTLDKFRTMDWQNALREMRWLLSERYAPPRGFEPLRPR